MAPCLTLCTPGTKKRPLGDSKSFGWDIKPNTTDNPTKVGLLEMGLVTVSTVLLTGAIYEDHLIKQQPIADVHAIQRFDRKLAVDAVLTLLDTSPYGPSGAGKSSISEHSSSLFFVKKQALERAEAGIALQAASMLTLC